VNAFLAEHSYISRDTVYRTLAMMEERGIIGSVLFVGNSKRYDPNIANHHHLVGLRCRKIVDFTAPLMDRLEPPPSTTRKFRVLRTTVHMEGICEECACRTRRQCREYSFRPEQEIIL